jgi:hypothetical protein
MKRKREVRKRGHIHLAITGGGDAMILRGSKQRK